MNEERPAKMHRRRSGPRSAGRCTGKTVALLGLTFKPNTDDLRESPALAILDGDAGRGRHGACLRPGRHAGRPGDEANRRHFLRQTSYEALEGADGLVVATEWNQFRGLDADALKSRLRGNVVCDLRNVYEPEIMRAKGFDYVAVGR